MYVYKCWSKSAPRHSRDTLIGQFLFYSRTDDAAAPLFPFSFPHCYLTSSFLSRDSGFIHIIPLGIRRRRRRRKNAKVHLLHMRLPRSPELFLFNKFWLKIFEQLFFFTSICLSSVAPPLSFLYFRTASMLTEFFFLFFLTFFLFSIYRITCTAIAKNGIHQISLTIIIMIIDT